MTATLFRSIMVAIDDSDVSNRALERAVELAQAMDAQLTIVHVLSSSEPSSPKPLSAYATAETLYLDESMRQQYEQAWASYMQHCETLLHQKVKAAQAAGVETISVQPVGNPGPSICDLAKTLEIDLLVVGSHQRRGISELLMGSTSNYTVHHAPCSVLVVHSQAKRREQLTESSKESVVA